MQNSETILSVDQNSTVKPKTSSQSFLAGVLALTGGEVIAKGIGLISSPIICRIFSPTVFGLDGIFRSIVTVIGALTCFRYELAIMLPEKKENAATLFVFCCILTVITTSLVGITIVYFGSAFMRSIEAEGLIPYLWFLPVCIFLTGMVLTFRIWCNREKQYKSLGYSRIFSSASRNFALITGGLLGYRTVFTLILCLAIESVIAIFVLLKRVILHDLPDIIRHCKIRLMLPLAKRYIKFPMITSISTLLNTSLYQIPVFLFSYYLGITIVGYYTRSLLLIGIPSVLIGGAISEVFFQRVTQWKNERRPVDILIEGILLRLFYLMILPYVIIVLFGKDIYSIVLGNQWSEAGIYASILVPYYFSLALTTPLVDIFVAYEKQGHDLLFNIMLLILTTGSIILGGTIFSNARLIMLLFSLAGTIAHISRFGYILFLAKVSLYRIMRQFSQYFVLIVPILIIIVIARWWLNLSPLWLVAILTITLLIYYYLALHQDKYFRRVMWTLLQETLSKKNNNKAI